MYLWTNKKGYSWTLTKKSFSPDTLEVGPECPYYKKGHTEATLEFDTNGEVFGILGPHGSSYVKPFNPPSDNKIVGHFIRDKPAHKLKKHHYVEITAVAEGIYRWTDGKGRSWRLT